ncbi:MAG: ABC-2 family transporter protein [Verrucomicrobiae bacterium]|nr:ABC-2 family transporter protein [Verrucomicrobiae bacterium]
MKDRDSHALARMARVYGMLCRNSFIREMNFKVNFLLWLVVEVLWFALQLIFISVIYEHTERIATWSKYEVILLVGASHFIQQIFSALFLNNCVNLSELVRTGKLDFLLLLPVNTRFIISLKQLDPGAFINAGTAVAVMVYALHRLGTVPGALQIAGFLLLCGAGVMIHYSLMFLLSTISFWTVRAQGIVWGYYNLFNLARLPDAAFRPGVFKVVFTYALPMLLVANVPTKVLADKLGSPWEIALLLLMTAACYAASALVWRVSVQRYTSASS